MLRSHGEEVIGERSRPGREGSEEGCGTALFFSSSTRDGHTQIVTLHPKLHLSNAALPRGPKPGGVGWGGGGGKQQAGQGSSGCELSS